MEQARQPTLDFFNPYAHGFARVAVAVPRMRVADPAFNAERDDRAAARRPRAQGAVAGRVPGAGPVGLHLRRPVPPARAARRLRGGAGSASSRRRATIPVLAVVGLPLRVDHRLFNCAAVVARRHGPRRRAQDLPAELRRVLRGAPVQRRPTPRCATRDRRCSATTVPFGADLLFEADEPAAADVCVRDLRGRVGADPAVDATRRWPARRCCVNLSASNITIGKADYRHQLVSLQSARCLAAYLYSSAGLGESTTDLAWDGQALIYENGDLLAESERFVNGSQLHLRRRRPRAPLARAHAAEHASATSVGSTRRALRELPHGSPSSWRCRRARRRCALQRRSSASRTCRPTRRAATSAAPRSTTSRSRRWCSGCGDAASRRS